MSQMLKSSGAMGAATLASRILGMVREIVYASCLGGGHVAAAFKAAFMIPNLFRRLLGEGALTAAFIPIFKEKERTAGEEDMWRAANATISGLITAAAALIGIVLLGITLVLLWDQPAAAASGARVLGQPVSENALPSFGEPGWLDADTRLMLSLTRIMFPYLLFVCLAAIFMGMLNARGQFFVPALGAAVLNGVLIITVLFIAPIWGSTPETRVFPIAVGVLVAGLAQALYQLPPLWRQGFRLRWVSPWKNETVRLVVRRMVPGMMGVAAFQLNVLLTAAIALGFSPPIYAAFDYAVRLMELPQGVFGISLATYLLPTLSGLAAEKKYPEFRATLGQGLGYLSFANLIASVLLIVLARPIVRLLFEHGEFTAFDTQRTAFALAFLAPGLIAFSMVNILARAFYALGDTKTPMKISAFCLVSNLGLLIVLIRPLEEGGLGLANTLSSLLNVGLLSYALRRKLKFLNLVPVAKQMLSMAGAAILSGIVAWLAQRGWESWLGHSGVLRKLGAVFIPMSVASLAYLGLTLWLQIPQAREFVELVKRRLIRRS
jgi:putative peptidoglycan lipid II flippase